MGLVAPATGDLDHLEPVTGEVVGHGQLATHLFHCVDRHLQQLGQH